MTKLDHLVAAWWQCTRLARGDRQARHASDEWFWAVEEVGSVVDSRSPAVVDLLVRLAEAAETDSDVGDVGAGPLEDLFSEHGRWLESSEGEGLLTALAEASRQSEKFRLAMGWVWYDSDEIPHAVRDRLPGLPPPLGE